MPRFSRILIIALLIIAGGVIFSSVPAFSSYLTDLNVDYLENGLKIITIEDHKDPIITFQVWYRVGGRDEATGKTGLAHLTEHMMFKGSNKYKKGEVSRIVAKHGGKENAFTSKDYTAYFQNFSKDKLEISLEVESDRMSNLIIDPDEFLLERDVVMEERRQRTDDSPTSALLEEVAAVAFKVHPYRNPTIGWMTDLENLSSKDLEDWYKTYYIPNNATIILVGDFKREEALLKIKDYFDKTPKAPSPPALSIVEPEQEGEKRVWVRREAQLPFFVAGYRAPHVGQKDVFPLEILESVLSSGRSSRLYKALVYDKQLAMYAGGSYDNISVGPNLFYLYAGVKPGIDVKEVEEAMYEEIERIKEHGISERELQKAKNQLEASFIMGQDSIFYQGMLLGRLESVGMDHTYLLNYPKNIRKVSIADVARVANKYFESDKRTVGILVPEREGEKDEKI